MNSKADNVFNVFETSLQRLEQSVEAPVVPGESQRWLQNAVKTLERVLLLLQGNVNKAHGESFAAIGSEDSGLLARVQRMQREDVAIGAELKNLAERSDGLLEIVSQAQEGEHNVNESLNSFADDTIALIIRIRKQEAALETWYNEALQRDRGTVDYMQYLYAKKRNYVWRLVATFDTQQQLRAYVRWATLASTCEHAGKYEQGSVLAGCDQW